MIQPRKQINNIYGYVRVSSEQQVKDGSSLDEQKRIIEQNLSRPSSTGRSMNFLLTLVLVA
jgi:hypothetical protein